jgi:multifunctional beta-oxidation protein
VVDGHAVIKSAVDAFGTVTILINNAGILRSVFNASQNALSSPVSQRQEVGEHRVHISQVLKSNSFTKMSDQEWDAVQLVHLKGAYSCTKAAWPLFKNQKFGRIINTSSAAGLYGKS